MHLLKTSPPALTAVRNWYRARYSALQFRIVANTMQNIVSKVQTAQSICEQGALYGHEQGCDCPADARKTRWLTLTLLKPRTTITGRSPSCFTSHHMLAIVPGRGMRMHVEILKLLANSLTRAPKGLSTFPEYRPRRTKCEQVQLYCRPGPAHERHHHCADRCAAVKGHGRSFG